MEEIGDLIPVSIKSDLVWSSCMLYHNKCNIKSPNQISFIGIDRDNQEWASICIESMKMNYIKRVLLIGETLPSVSTLNQIERAITVWAIVSRHRLDAILSGMLIAMEVHQSENI